MKRVDWIGEGPENWDAMDVMKRGEGLNDDEDGLLDRFLAEHSRVEYEMDPDLYYRQHRDEGCRVWRRGVGMVKGGTQMEGDGHWYEGKPSVTTILDSVMSDRQLARWRGKVGNEEADRISREAAHFGDRVHEFLAVVEIMNRPDLAPEDRDIHHPVKCWLEWVEMMGLRDGKWQYAEEVFVSDRGFGGCPDRVGLLGGDKELTLVDIKTGKPNIKHRFQLAGYKILLHDNRVMVDRKIAVYLPHTREDGEKARIVEFTNQRDEQGFMWCLGLFNLMRE